MTIDERPTDEAELGEVGPPTNPRPYWSFLALVIVLITAFATLSFCCGIVFAGSLSELFESIAGANQTAVTQNVVVEFGITQIAVTQLAITRIVVEEPPTPIFPPEATLTPLITDTQTPLSLPAGPQPIGQPVVISGYTITLNSAEFDVNLLTADFTIQNTGSVQGVVNFQLNFTAEDSDGFLLAPAILSCPSAIEGEILPGEELRGTACWNGPFTEVISIYFTPNPVLPETVLWEVSQ